MNTQENNNETPNEQNAGGDVFADARKYVNDLFGKKEVGTKNSVGELASDDIEITDNEARLEAELTDVKDKLLRTNAEFDNYRKRTMRERMELLKTATTDLVIAILPVLDDFERALKAMQQGPQNEAIEGVTLIYNKLKTNLEQKGLTTMISIDTKFDADLHEALTIVPVEDDSRKGIVIEEMEKGYYLGGKVIRHAKVVVGG